MILLKKSSLSFKKSVVQANKPLLFLLLALFIIKPAFTQELNCNVQVLAPQIQGSDKQVFETLKKEITEFLNNRKWTSDQFLVQERIECSMLITVSDRPNSDEFKATVQVQTRRPIYGSSYNSTLINFNDQDFSFRYIEFEPLDFTDQTFISTLTSTLAFYAYIIIGLDYDSFALNAGTPYFQKANNIVNVAQAAKEKGWKAFEGNRNRYWMAENLINPQLNDMHTVYYNYHRLGMDLMAEKVADGRKVILESLKLLKK